MTKRTEWVRWHDAKRLIQSSLFDELSELAIEFAAVPERKWTGEEIAVILKKRVAKRRKLGLVHALPGDELPGNAMRMQIG